MFLENYYHVIAGILMCMMFVQQGFSAFIPPYESNTGLTKRQHRQHHKTATAESILPARTVAASHIGSKPTPTKGFVPTFTSAATADVPEASGSRALNGDIIIPFYLYPSTGAWSPLEELITANPEVKFTIIINPDNGPGSAALPDENFLAAIPKLTAFDNVLVIGYVSTAKGSRNIAEVKKDIETYAGWASASGDASFTVHGIFLDEAPSEYTADNVAYFKDLALHIKQAKGLGPSNHVVTNPGTVPNAAYLEIPDLTVIFESPYSEFQEEFSSDVFQNIQGQDLSRFASIVYDVPKNIDISVVLAQLRTISSQTYISNLDTYQAFDSTWHKLASLLSV